MAKEGDIATASLIALGLGFLVGAAVASGASDQRQTFSDAMRDALRRHGIEMRAANLIQDTHGAVWVLTLRLPNQHVMTLNVPFNPPADALNLAECEGVAVRVHQFLISEGLVLS